MSLCFLLIVFICPSISNIKDLPQLKQADETVKAVALFAVC